MPLQHFCYTPIYQWWLLARHGTTNPEMSQMSTPSTQKIKQLKQRRGTSSNCFFRPSQHEVQGISASCWEGLLELQHGRCLRFRTLAMCNPFDPDGPDVWQQAKANLHGHGMMSGNKQRQTCMVTACRASVHNPFCSSPNQAWASIMREHEKEAIILDKPDVFMYGQRQRRNVQLTEPLLKTLRA